MNENYLQRKKGLKGRLKSPWQGLLFGLTLAASIFTGGHQASAQQQDVCLGNALQNGGLRTTSNGNYETPATIPSWQQTSGSNLRPWHQNGSFSYPGINPVMVDMNGNHTNSAFLYQTVNNIRIIDDSITVHVTAVLQHVGLRPRLAIYWNSSTSPVATVTLSNTVGSTTYAYAGFNGARVFGNTNTPDIHTPVSVTIRIPVSGITNPNAGTLRIRAEKVSGSGLSSNNMYAKLYSVFIEENCMPNTSTPLTPFVCGAGYAYLTQDYNQGDGNTVEGKTGLYRVNIATGAFDTIKEHVIDTALTQFRQLNAIAYNPLDNFIYAQRLGTDQFLRIGADGSYELFRMPGIRSAHYGAADIDSNGIYYLHNTYTRHGYIDRIDLNTMTILPPLNVTGIAGNVIDIAVNPRDKFIYAIASTQSDTYYELQKINPHTGAVTNLATHTISSGGPFGALWFDSEGNLYGSQNADITGSTTNGGAIWKFQTVYPYAKTNISLGPITSSNDGARCPYAKIIDKVDISGKVWHDANADAITNNAETGVNPGGNLYATLVNQETGKVISSVLVNPTNGSYLFEDVNAVGIYQVILTNGSKASGTTLTSADLLPSEWEHTGTNVDGTANPSNKTGVIADIVTYGEDVTGLDFGVRYLNTTDAVNDENSTWVNTPVSGDVTTNDFDREGNNQTFGTFLNQNGSGAPIFSGATISGVNSDGTPEPNAGTLIFNPDGTYTYNPAPNFVGNISVPYSICDDGNPVACDTAVLEITVSPLPTDANSVIANNDEYYSFGEPVQNNILINDADPQADSFVVVDFVYDSDGDGIPDTQGTVGGSPVPVAGVDEKGNPVPNAGTLTIGANGNLVFTPAPSFAGKVYVDYTINDDVTPDTAEDDAKIVITVVNDKNGPKNDPPFGGDDFSYTEVNTPVNGNFFHNDYDPNNNPISIKDFNGNPVIIIPNGLHNPVDTLVTDKGGTVVLYTDGTYTYTPPADYTGPDRVVYEICDVTVVDPQPLCAEATIHMLIGDSKFDISGMVWHDHTDGDAVQDLPSEKPVSGSNDNNGGNSTVTSGNIYANLVDNTTGKVIASTQVNPDGTYLFEDVTRGDYSVILTNAPQTVGNSLSNGSLPTGWIATGVNVDSVPDVNNKTNVIDLGVVKSQQDDINFAIQQPPTTNNSIYLINSPTGGSVLPLNGTVQAANNNAIAGTVQSDPEDGTPVTVTIVELPTASNNQGNPVLYYDGVPVNAPGTSLGTPSNPYDPNKLSIQFNGTNYTDVTFKFTATDAAGAVSNTSTYTLIWNEPVPVVLLSFNANVADNNVRLRWTTVTEQNSKGFDVERSTDAKQWTKVQFVKTKAIDGNSSSELNYEFTDAEVAPGKHYYRLKLIDNDGQYSYSNVRAVVVANGKMSLYPNPASSQVMVSGLTDNAKVAVYDVAGRQVLTSTISPVANAINIGTLPEGVYNVVITDEQGVMNTFKVYKK